MFNVFFLTFLVLFNPVYGEPDIQMDWIIDGQLDKPILDQEDEPFTLDKESIVATEQTRPYYDKFVTNNQYSIGSYKISINSKEGQELNALLIEQRELQDESFKHKIRYYDRFSDGYVEIAEALLDPIGDNKYIIQGRVSDHNPNSNLEIFVLERGYSLDDLEAIPNDIFSPKEFTLGRQLMADFEKTDKGGVDLRQYSPNHLDLNKAQIQERMLDSFSEQTLGMFADIMAGNTLQSELTAKTETVIPAPTNDQSEILDSFEFEQPKFENTGHILHSLQDDTVQALPSTDDTLLALVPVAAGLAIFAYLVGRMLSRRKSTKLVLQVTQTQTDYKGLTKDMLADSLDLYNTDKRKEAYEMLSQAIRYYYSQHLKIFSDVTNSDLIRILEKNNLPEYENIRNWLLLCGSVEYAKYRTNDNEFKDALSRFSTMIS